MTPPPVINRAPRAFASPLLRHRRSIKCEWLAQAFKDKEDEKILGAHLAKGGIRPGNFIGMVWIGEGESRAVLRVDCKLEGMDYIRMYCECAERPQSERQFALPAFGRGRFD